MERKMTKEFMINVLAEFWGDVLRVRQENGDDKEAVAMFTGFAFAALHSGLTEIDVQAARASARND